jgi:hypothetical protein
MLIGSAASFLFSEYKLRAGFAVGIIACCFGITVAVMAQQWGFVAYNIVLISCNIRGLVIGDRRRKRRTEDRRDESFSVSEAVPIRVRAR